MTTTTTRADLARQLTQVIDQAHGIATDPRDPAISHAVTYLFGAIFGIRKRLRDCGFVQDETWLTMCMYDTQVWASADDLAVGAQDPANAIRRVEILAARIVERLTTDGVGQGGCVHSQAAARAFAALSALVEQTRAALVDPADLVDPHTFAAIAKKIDEGTNGALIPELLAAAVLRVITVTTEPADLRAARPSAGEL